MEELAKLCNLIQIGRDRGSDKRDDETVQSYLDRHGLKPDFVFHHEDTTGYKCVIQVDMHRTPYNQLKYMNWRKYDIVFITYPECPYAYMGTKKRAF